MDPKAPYVLGTGDDELQRLGLQHRLWADAAHAAYRRAGITIGQRVLDVGSGPGFASFDLAQLVTQQGAVVAVDESAPFLTYLEQQAHTRELPQLRARQGCVQRLGEVLGNEAPFDLAYARWVLCFVPDPAAVVAGVAAALKPGGRFVVHDYFNYGAMTLAPRHASHDRAVQATITAWRQRGGDPDVVGRLPSLLEAAGFAVEHIDVHQRIARGTDSMFGWIDTWWHTFVPKLVAMALMTKTEADDLLAELTRRRGDPHHFAHLPPVYEVIAQKR